ncbi:MAG: hypothetical protein JWM89_3508 [Acidimicrobiales bacterium]|nr:hypothetical protein [Acidimicrobiales bacterium]
MTAGRSVDRLDLSGTPIDIGDFERALQIVVKTGYHETFAAELNQGWGAPRRNDILGFLVACQVNAFRREHTGELLAITRVLNGFSSNQCDRVGLVHWTIENSYDRVDRIFNDITTLERSSVVGRDPSQLDNICDRFSNAMIEASISQRDKVSTAVAYDATAIEGWANPHFLELDGEPGPSDEEAGIRKEQTFVQATFGVGPDGRKIPTKDRDARSGHRSAVAKKKASLYTGYQCHIGVQTRSAEIRNPVDGVALGPEVPQLIRAAAITEAGAHAARTCRHLITRYGSGEWAMEDIIADRGMTLGVDEWQLPLRAEGRRPFFDLHTQQRGIKTTSKNFVTVDGWPVSHAAPPSALVGEGGKPLPMPSRGASHEARDESARRFKERARYTFRVHQRPDADGAMRFRGPLASGRLRTNAAPYEHTMRLPHSKPLVDLPEDWEPSFDGVITVMPRELPLYQSVQFGTRAWQQAYLGRRQAAESANAGLKQAKANIENKGHFKVFTRNKISFLMAFEMVAYNVRRSEAFWRDQRLKRGAQANGDGRTARERAQRRAGTNAEIAAEAASASAADVMCLDGPSVDTHPPP